MSDDRAAVPTWNASTAVVQIIRDRMREQGWGTLPAVQLPVLGPGLQLDERPADLGEGIWR
jgi:hypothetical protein